MAYKCPKCKVGKMKFQMKMDFKTFYVRVYKCHLCRYKERLRIKKQNKKKEKRNEKNSMAFQDRQEEKRIGEEKR